MAKRWGSGILATLALLGAIPAPCWAAKALPAPPSRYVLDEPGILDEASRRTLESLLVEHDRITGEQIVVAIFQSLEGEEIASYTSQVFERWAIGSRGKDNGALLAVYWNEHRSRIEVGYGFEGVLTDARSKRILSDTLAPLLREGRPGAALEQAVFEILRAVGSPMVESGQAEAILRSGGWAPRHGPVRARGSGIGGFPLVFLGFILLTILFNILSSAEAHFTRKGWTRARPLSRLRRGGGFGPFFPGGGWGGGGGSWRGGGDGGFSGGGGRSGGGGASGGW